MTSRQQVRNDTVVSIDYTVRLDNGEILDSTEDSAPLEYLHGYNNIISGLEKALEGMGVGEQREITVAPAEAYGERSEEAAAWYPREAFPVEDLEPGMTFQVEDDEGRPVLIHVSEVEDKRVLVDYNHPLAGETLHFEVEVVDVRPATPEELEHGHAHHGHGHH